MNEQLSKMKAAIEARVRAEPGNAGAWRELAQMMLGDVDDAYALALQMHNPPKAETQKQAGRGQTPRKVPRQQSAWGHRARGDRPSKGASSGAIWRETILRQI